MTEKQYGGSKNYGSKGTISSKGDSNIGLVKTTKKNDFDENEISELIAENIEKLKKAGAIARQTINYAKSFIKKDTPLLEIAEKIEAKIIELGGKPAFPVNLSINEVAAHSTPSFNDSSLAYGLLKVDLGVHIDGFVADTAFSLDLENNEENKNLINAAESALNEATKVFSLNSKIKTIGATVENEMKKFGVIPIANLSGHSIEQYDLHAGVTIPNFDTSQDISIPEGVYAIEPFSTKGLGSVRDGRPSGIYHLEKPGNVRDLFAREVLQYIEDEFSTLPFCSRWIYKKFSSRGLLALRRIEEAGLLHHYAQLIENGKGKVAQAEHTIIITKNEKIITTL